MIKIASFGCGVDSVAGLLLNSNYDEIIFADTGSELPETYAYLDYFEKKSGLKITKVTDILYVLTFISKFPFCFYLILLVIDFFIIFYI